MVEANEPQAVQPQDKITPQCDETTIMIDAMEKRFATNTAVMNERIDLLKQLKEE